MSPKHLHGLLAGLLAVVLLSTVCFSISFASSPAQADGQPYIVKSGDSLYQIAAQFYGNGNIFAVIVDATNEKAKSDRSFATITNPRRISVGQKLWIPKQAGMRPVSTTQPTATEPPRPASTTQPTPTESLGVHFIEPVTGASVPPQFEVKMGAGGFNIEPAGEIHEGAGHMHLLIDTDFTPAGEVVLFDEQHLHFGKGQLTTTLQLDPGVHVLRLQFANGAHIALDGPAYQDTITVTVQASPTAQAGATQTGVHFIEPVTGASVPPQFEVKMGAGGFKVEPAGEIHEGAGHMHLLIDTDFTPAGEVVLFDEQHLHFGKGQLTTTLQLDPGVHVLRLQFANGAHIALDGPAYQDTITVTVQASPTAQAGATQTGVHFIEPVTGASVPPQFEVKMGAGGFKVEPAGEIHEGAGHMHLLIDTDFTPPDEVVLFDEQHLHFGKGQLTTTLQLDPGLHVLRLQFANGAHIAFDGEEYRDEITVTVAEP